MRGGFIQCAGQSANTGGREQRCGGRGDGVGVAGHAESVDHGNDQQIIMLASRAIPIGLAFKEEREIHRHFPGDVDRRGEQRGGGNDAATEAHPGGDEAGHNGRDTADQQPRGPPTRA